MKKELPNGWKEKTIGDIFKFIRNYSNSRAELNDYDEISYIHYGDMHKYYRHRIECDKMDFPKISAEKLSKDISKISYAKNGDLIVVDASEDYEGTCISAEIKNLNYKLVSGMHTFLLRDENKIFTDGYRGYIFYNHDVHIQCCKIATGISVYGISQENLKNIKIMIPPLYEQKRIVDILSTFDDLIENLTKLIEKKELYKKGVMQRVLTGKVRFNGFKDEWREINLRDIVEEYSIPNTNKLKQYTIGKNGIKELDDFRHSIDKHKVFKKNDLIVGIGIDEINVNINLDYGCCSPVYRVYSINTNLLNPKFGYFYIRKAIDRIKNKITRKSTRREFEFDHKEFIKYSILLPSLEEQNKIAELLTLIDKDIDNLKQLLHLRKLQKKGVMQKLLTGEVRI